MTTQKPAGLRTTDMTVEVPLQQLQYVNFCKGLPNHFGTHLFGGMWRKTAKGVIERRYLGQWLEAVRQEQCNETGAACESIRHTGMCLEMKAVVAVYR